MNLDELKAKATLTGAVLELIANPRDAYHTMKELYEHRCVLFIYACSLQKDRCAWKRDFEGWFCLYLETPSGQVSYHCPNYMLPLIEGIKEVPDYKFDGHKSEDVLFRLRNEALKSSPKYCEHSGARIDP